MEIDFTNLLIVAAAAFAAPLALGLVPSLRLPAVVLEIVLGIVLGPSVLDWARVDEPVQVMSLLGLAFLLLLAGLEVEFDQFRGRLLKLTGLGFLASLAIALVFALGLHGAGLVKSPLLIAIIAAGTSLGVVIPVLQDAGKSSTQFGQVVHVSVLVFPLTALSLLRAETAPRSV